MSQSRRVVPQRPRRALLAARPDVVSLSALFDPQLPALRLLAPQIPIVVGGATFARAIEGVLAELLRPLSEHEREPDLVGLCYQRADGGFTINADGKPLKLETVPAADFGDLDQILAPLCRSRQM